MNERTQIEDLIGCTLVNIHGKFPNPERLTFTTDDDVVFDMYHPQNCCESVRVEEIIGDLSDVIGSPILHASEETNSFGPDCRGDDGSHTWTFYRLSTIKGSVTLRWLGESNGFYGEEVSFEQRKPYVPGRESGFDYPEAYYANLDLVDELRKAIAELEVELRTAADDTMRDAFESYAIKQLEALVAERDAEIARLTGTEQK